MKVVQINVVYEKGSTGKIVKDIHSNLLDYHFQSKVYYGRGVKSNDKNVKKIAPELIMKLQSLRAKITGYAYGGAFISTLLLLHYLKVEKPDIVHLHCLNGYFVNIYKVFQFLKDNNIPTVLTCHAEFMYTGGCAHAFDCDKWISGCTGKCPQRNKNLPCSFFFDRSKQNWELMNNALGENPNILVCCVSDWMKNRALMSPFFTNKEIKTIKNGLDTNVFHYRKNEALELKKQLGITKQIILHVTPDFSSPIKGGKYILSLANEIKDVIFIIIGKNIENSILPKNIIPISYVSNQIELSKYYSLSDLVVITSEKETFSMVCAEAITCGTPVVGFKAGGPESIAVKEYSEFVPFGDLLKLKDVILKWLNKEIDKNLISKSGECIYSSKKMTNNYLTEYINLVKKQNK